MKRVYIAYYLGRKRENPRSEWFDNLVTFVTGSKYSHVEIIYDFSYVTKKGYSYSSTNRDGGVRSKLIDFGSGSWEVYELKTDKTWKDVIEWFGPKLGAGYDWRGVVGSVLSIVGHNPKKHFCSEVIMDFLGYEKSYTYTPQDVYDTLCSYQNRVL